MMKEKEHLGSTVYLATQPHSCIPGFLVRNKHLIIGYWRPKRHHVVLPVVSDRGILQWIC